MWSVSVDASRPGQWTIDPLEYAALVEANTRLGLANPPRSYLDIPRVGPPLPGWNDTPPPAPVPLPAPLALLLAGLAGLGAVRLRVGGRRAREA